MQPGVPIGFASGLHRGRVRLPLRTLVDLGPADLLGQLHRVIESAGHHDGGLRGRIVEQHLRGGASIAQTAHLVDALRNGTPSIELNPNTGQKPNQGIPADANTLVVGVWMLQPGEDAIVGQRIRAALTKKA